jgi:hypothetical protein
MKKVLLVLLIGTFGFHNVTASAIPRASVDLFNIRRNIAAIDPQVTPKFRGKIAKWIAIESFRHGIDHRIMTSLLSMESHFKAHAYNVAGDSSMAQINFKTWAPMFQRKGITLSLERLQTDDHYGIKVMAYILKHYKNKHPGNLFWMLYYHSGNKSKQAVYKKLLVKIMKKINSVKQMPMMS